MESKIFTKEEAKGLLSVFKAMGLNQEEVTKIEEGLQNLTDEEFGNLQNPPAPRKSDVGPEDKKLPPIGGGFPGDPFLRPDPQEGGNEDNGGDNGEDDNKDGNK